MSSDPAPETAPASMEDGPSGELSAAEIEHKIITLARSAPKGITDKDILDELPDLQPAKRAKAINTLLAQGLLDIFSQKGSLIYKLKDLKKAVKVEGDDNEERIVYQIIEEAGNMGIWIRDIRSKSNLMATQLNKVLKAMENKKLIKSVNSVNASKKKVFMLFNLEPHPSVTGGAWYSDQDFEVEFVDILNQQCHRFLLQKLETAKGCSAGPIAARTLAFASCNDVWNFVNDLGISKVKLAPADLEAILDTLVYDGKAERTKTPEGKRLYKAVEPLLSAPGLVCMPCGVCPVMRNCGDCGWVVPKKCVYMKEWLE
ncbi:DNA-directed RNA polymerase III subunit RPC6 [Anabrus simplex]|uniref:DNA-directed RNA polymerase III subunit RPC6 n=1 Tax=Anabrus simplex TaxID=316456 RepID=UPI0034DD8045